MCSEAKLGLANKILLTTHPFLRFTAKSHEEKLLTITAEIEIAPLERQPLDWPHTDSISPEASVARQNVLLETSALYFNGSPHTD